MHSSANSDPSPYSSKTKLFHIEFSDFHVSKGDSIKPGVINSNANSSKRNTSLMKIRFLCQLMSPLLFTCRRRRPFGYVNSDNLRGSRTELGW